MMASGLRWTTEMLEEFQRRSQRSSAQPAPAVEDDAPAPSKYRNKKIEVDGIVFDSRKEARVWFELVARQAAGEISDLRRQVYFELAPPVKLDGEAKMKPALRYQADFTFIENGHLVVCDCKSAITRRNPVFRIKKHLMIAVLGLQIREV
jgi:hypothetical protein